MAELDAEFEAAHRAADLPGALAVLARTSLLLLTPPSGAGWDVALAPDGRPFVTAYTSGDTLTAIHPDGAPVRLLSVLELSAIWPDPGWGLVINPGLPTQTQLDAGQLQDIAALAARPATERESALARAARAGDAVRYLTLLSLEDVAVPLTVTGAEGRSDWFWVPPGMLDGAGTSTGGVIAVYSSRARMEVASRQLPWTTLAFAELMARWPAGAALAVDPGMDQGTLLSAEVMDDVRAQYG